MGFQPPLPTIPHPYLVPMPGPGGWVVCMPCPVPPARCHQSLTAPWSRRLAGFCVRVCCVSCLLLAFPPLKPHCDGACVDLKTPCSFSVASPVPSHQLGSALVHVHVLLHALPCHQWSVFVCMGGVVGRLAGPLQWALRTLITGPALQLSGEGGGSHVPVGMRSNRPLKVMHTPAHPGTHTTPGLCLHPWHPRGRAWAGGCSDNGPQIIRSAFRGQKGASSSGRDPAEHRPERRP